MTIAVLDGENRKVRERAAYVGHDSIWWCPFCDHSMQGAITSCIKCGAQLVPAELADVPVEVPSEDATAPVEAEVVETPTEDETAVVETVVEDEVDEVETPEEAPATEEESASGEKS
jgi:hypothetical protein